MRKIGPPATSLLNSQVLFSQGLDLIFTQLRPEKRGPRFLRWLPPATFLGGSSTRGKFTCLQRHPVTLIGGKSWKCFAFWFNLDRWKSPFAFWLFVAHWFSQWTNGPIGPADYSRWWTGYLSNQSCVTTDSWTAPGKWFLWWGVDWALKDQATSPFGHRKSILVEAKQASKKMRAIWHVQTGKIPWLKHPCYVRFHEYLGGLVPAPIRHGEPPMPFGRFGMKNPCWGPARDDLQSHLPWLCWEVNLLIPWSPNRNAVLMRTEHPPKRGKLRHPVRPQIFPVKFWKQLRPWNIL